jgi:hypothetical protein
MVFAASAAQDARGWEDQVLMFVGDVWDNQLPPHAALPKQLMAIQTNKVKVAKWGECVLHCATSKAELMEAVPEDDPPAMYDEVTVRKGAYVPPFLLALFLNGFSTIQHVIIAVDARLTELETSVDGYLPLLDWLRAQRQPGRAPQRSAPSTQQVRWKMRFSPKSSSIASSTICQIGALVGVLRETRRRTLQTKA